METNSQVRGICTVGCLALAIAFVTPPAARAQVPCAQRDVSGKFQAVQSNGIIVSFNLRQTGSELHGSASYSYVPGSTLGVGDAPKNVDGAADGSIVGARFAVNVYWQDRKGVGIYTATVASDDGHLTGATHERNSPGDSATWYSNRAFPCIAATSSGTPAPAPAPPPAPPPSAPSSPTSVSAGRRGTTDVLISWTPGERAQWFVVERRIGIVPLLEAGSTPWAPVSGKIASSVRTFVARDAVPLGNLKNIYRVVALNGQGRTASQPVVEHNVTSSIRVR